MTAQTMVWLAQLLTLCSSIFVSSTTAIPQFEDIETISVRATKITPASELNDINLARNEDSNNSAIPVHSLYPDLKFTCNTTLIRWWFIGRAQSDSIQLERGPSLHLWTPSGDGQYFLTNSATSTSNWTHLAGKNSILVMNEPNGALPVHVNDVISIEQTRSRNQGLLLYKLGGGPTGHLGTAQEVDGVSRFQNNRNRSDYPMVAVETASSECVSGFLSLTLLQSVLSQVFTPSSNQHRLIPSLNFTCSGVVTRWMVGAEMKQSITDRNSFNISLWRNIRSRDIAFTALIQELQLVKEVTINHISSTTEPNVYTVTTTAALEFQPGWFIGISQPVPSSLAVYSVIQMSNTNFVFDRLNVGSNIQLAGSDRQQGALPLLRPMEIEQASGRQCDSNFISEEVLINRALLVPSIIYDPQQQQSPDVTAQAQPTVNTVILNSNESGFNINADNIRQRQIEPTDTLSQIGSVYVFCDPFSTEGTIVSWTFAARRQQILRTNSINRIQSYPQLLILQPKSEIGSNPCNAPGFSKASMTMIRSPPILLETLNMYEVDVDLVYNRGDVLGVFQPSDSLAVLSLAFMNAELSNTTAALRLEANLASGQITVDADAVMVGIEPLMTLTFSTTKSNTEPSSQPSSTTSSTDGEKQTQPETQDPGLQALEISNVTITGISVGVTIVLLLMFIILLLVTIFIIVRRRNRKHGDIPMSSLHTNGSAVSAGVDLLGNPTYAAAAGGNRNEFGKADEYEVPVRSQATIAPNFEATSLYQEVSQPYETPLSLTRNNANERNDTDNPYHILEAPFEEQVYEAELYVPAGDHRRVLTSATQQPVNVYATLTESQFSSVKSDGSYFMESETFWKPATDQEQLYQQLLAKKYREIPRPNIKAAEKLGSGHFGEVCKGVWNKSKDESIEVAVKKLKSGATEEDRVKFLQEAAIMGQFRHPNIVKLLGVVTIGDPVMIVLELMVSGDLRSYLNKQKPKMPERLPSVWPKILLNFCQHIAAGMDYLHKKGFIHRDLAARNILVAVDSTCKISDFGLSRDLEEENYYVTKGGMIPVKWTAPEALNFKKFSLPCDVWSFGIVMYEIWSLGNKPYKKIKNLDVLPKVEEGYRMPPPPGCPREIYRIMIQCWHPESSCRPSFSEVLDSLLQPPNELLYWLEEDKEVHPEADVLGASLAAGEQLYPELQNTYTLTYETAKAFLK